MRVDAVINKVLQEKHDIQIVVRTCLLWEGKESVGNRPTTFISSQFQSKFPVGLRMAVAEVSKNRKPVGEVSCRDASKAG